ncbi:MAG: SDR family NAD(P)-dependent oxidoreductase [Deltaproteobacteria bacterium]|nr:SDR family NAD(P)-dependent oxidoreductase [Deltaproteobacteria bacterium]
MSLPGLSNDAIRFDGQAALVTGSGRGLGRAYALALAARGARVVVNDLDAGPAEEVAREICAAGGQAVSAAGSVASAADGERIVEAASDAFGRLDALIHNAGILKDRSLVKMTDAEWKAVLSVHLDGAFYVTRPALARMRAQGYGRILLTTSSSGLYGNFGQANYAAAKMGLVGFMNALKLETRGKGDIRVNAISPTALSRMTERLFGPRLAELADPQQVVPMALLLCSRACPASGRIYRAGLGHFARVALVTGQGLACPEKIPTPEELLERMERIDDLGEAVELDSTAESLGFAARALGVELDELLEPAGD